MDKAAPDALHYEFQATPTNAMRQRISSSLVPKALMTISIVSVLTKTKR